MSGSAPQTAQSHAALIWLIRGTGAFIAGASAIAAVYFVCGIIIGAIRGQVGSLGPIPILIVLIFFGIISKSGYYIFRNVNTTTVANFSFIFALLWAIDWHHFLPPRLPKGMADYCRHNPFLIPFANEGPGPTYRYWLCLLAFYIFYKLIKAYLMRVLDLNGPRPPQNPPPFTPSDPDAPEFPQKSPLVRL